MTVTFNETRGEHSDESLISEKGMQIKLSIEEAIKSGDTDRIRDSAKDMLETIWQAAYLKPPWAPIEVNDDQVQDMIDFQAKSEGLLFPPGSEGQRIFFKISLNKENFGKKAMFYRKPSGYIGKETWDVYMKLFGTDEVILDLE
jgi:hypothetical protein